MGEPQGKGGNKAGAAGRAIAPPRGTRDFYPPDMLRRRWIEDTWRKVGVRHGFEEVDGPRFEHLDLYTVKSGEGIVSELFSFTRAGGETAFALRPEFTPTAARMVAAKANALPRPIKWFSVGPYFRAERPQRGRLREFLQWNVDIFGDDSARADADLLACCVDFLASLGLDERAVRIRYSDRNLIVAMLIESGVGAESSEAALQLLDKRDKISSEAFADAAQKLSLDAARFDALCRDASAGASERQRAFVALLDERGVASWCDFDVSIVRGLAYYTGMVFEVHEAGGKERAIAGGGRYDGLIELFGGPPTPAVGFAMGDVVLSLVLEDKGLMPSDNALRARTGQRVDVFVISNEQTEALLAPAVGALRRVGLHARHTHKATRNVGKMLKEASSLGARFAAIIESPEASPEQVTLKDLGSGGQHGVSLDALADEVIRRTRAADIPSDHA